MPEPQRLLDILRTLHPWLRDRVSTITIAPLREGGWEAVLAYLHHSAPPPPDCPIPSGSGEYPGNTHHALALSQDRPDTDLAGQLHQAQATVPLGQLDMVAFHPAAGAGVGWIIHTHTDEQERQEWLARIIHEADSG